MNVFKNLNVEEPSPKVASADGVIFPATCNLSVGAVTPRPSLPPAVITEFNVSELS